MDEKKTVFYVSLVRNLIGYCWKIKSMIRTLKIFVKLFTVCFKSSYKTTCTINDNKVSRLYYSYWTAKNLAKRI